MVPLSEPGSAAVFRWAEQTHSFDFHFAGEFYIKADGLVFFVVFFDKKYRRLANAAPCQPLCQARHMRHLTFLPVWPERRFPRVNHILPLSCPEPSTASGHVAVRPPPRPIRLAGRGPPSSCSHHAPSTRSPRSRHPANSLRLLELPLHTAFALVLPRALPSSPTHFFRPLQVSFQRDPPSI